MKKWSYNYNICLYKYYKSFQKYNGIKSILEMNIINEYKKHRSYLNKIPLRKARKSTQRSCVSRENFINKIFHTKTPIPRGTYPGDVFTKCTKDPGFLFPRKRAAHVVGTDAAAAAAVEIVAEPGFVPIVNFIPTLLQRQRAALRTRLAVEQVDSPSRTKRRTSASKRERKR